MAANISKKTTIHYIYRHDNHFLAVDDVSCKQCEYCGEQYFKGKVLKQTEEAFQHIHIHGKKPERVLVIPIEQFHQLQEAT